jgi:hypothetical protein
MNEAKAIAMAKNMTAPDVIYTILPHMNPFQAMRAFADIPAVASVIATDETLAGRALWLKWLKQSDLMRFATMRNNAEGHADDQDMDRVYRRLDKITDMEDRVKLQALFNTVRNEITFPAIVEAAHQHPRHFYMWITTTMRCVAKFVLASMKMTHAARVPDHDLSTVVTTETDNIWHDHLGNIDLRVNSVLETDPGHVTYSCYLRSLPDVRLFTRELDFQIDNDHAILLRTLITIRSEAFDPIAHKIDSIQPFLQVICEQLIHQRTFFQLCDEPQDFIDRWNVGRETNVSFDSMLARLYQDGEIRTLALILRARSERRSVTDALAVITTTYPHNPDGTDGIYLNEPIGSNCTGCKRPNNSYVCTGCNQAVYCGDACAERDWPEHLKECRRRK